MNVESGRSDFLSIEDAPVVQHRSVFLAATSSLWASHDGAEFPVSVRSIFQVPCRKAPVTIGGDVIDALGWKVEP